MRGPIGGRTRNTGLPGYPSVLFSFFFLDGESSHAMYRRENPRVLKTLYPYPRLSSKESLIRGIFPVHSPDGYAMLMSPNKGEAAVHSCHCPGNMAVHMRELLVRPWVSFNRGLVYVCPLLKFVLH